MIAAEQAAAAAAASSASAGAGAAAGAASGAGSAGAAAGGLTGEEIAAAQLAQEAGASGAAGTYGMQGGLLGQGTELAREAGASDPALMSDFQKYLGQAKEGFRSAGNFYKKLPPGVSNVAMQGLLGGGQQPHDTNYQGGGHGGPQQPIQNSTGLLGTHQLPRATPYAYTQGGPDDEEMKRRLMMMLQGVRQ